MTMKHILLGSAAALTLSLAACDKKADAPAETPAIEQVEKPALPEITVTAEELEGNPFLEEWTTPYGVQPFAEIKDEHYMPAIKQGILDLRADIDAIVNNPEPASFENTIVALDTAGKSLNKVASTFGNITGTDTNDTLKALQGQIWPMLTAEGDAINFNPDVFARVKEVYAQRDRLGLDEQDARLLPAAAAELRARDGTADAAQHRTDALLGSGVGAGAQRRNHQSNGGKLLQVHDLSPVR